MNKVIPVFSLDFPIFAKWYITGKCNLRCKHCYLTDYTKQADIKIVKDIIDYFSRNNLLHISFLGGEPLVRLDLEEIIYLCKKNNIKTKIATNGTLISNDRLKSLKEAGANHFQISLEGHSPELSDPIRGAGTFDLAMNAISLLKTNGFWSSIALTLSHENVVHLDDIFLKASDCGVDELKLSAFMPIGTGSSSIDKYLLTKDDIIYIKNKLSYLIIKYDKVKVNTAFIGSTYKNNCTTFGCGAGTNSIVINNDLTVSACDILTEEDRTKEIISKGDDIYKLWKDDILFKKWRREGNGSTPSINNFSEVHGHGCHVAYSTYGRNILN